MSRSIDLIADLGEGFGAWTMTEDDALTRIVTSANVALLNARMGAAELQIPALAITAERVSKSKPDPEGFLLAASTLGIPAADCVVFEDSGAGIRAGLDAGMTVIGVGSYAPAFGPIHHVDDLTQIEISPHGDGLEIRIC